ncbi:MAG: ribbon-helix-helix protein, CopG family [Actinomycetota bacterium]|nr:ribbon-helix-helix protein, CopG family [Actinomycetota bacterium]
MSAHGTRPDCTPITDDVIEALADEAERGYDVDTLLERRKPGRPPTGTAPAVVDSVRLDPELKRELLLRAAEEGISVSELIRHALRQYLWVG